MQTVREKKLQLRIERQEKLQDKLDAFQTSQFGKILERGDVLTIPTHDVINASLSTDVETVDMMVYSIGKDRGSQNPAIGLIYLDKNTHDSDCHNNYCLSYGITRLKRAYLTGSVDILVTDRNVGFSDIVSD